MLEDYKKIIWAVYYIPLSFVYVLLTKYAAQYNRRINDHKRK